MPATACYRCTGGPRELRASKGWMLVIRCAQGGPWAVSHVPWVPCGGCGIRRLHVVSQLGRYVSTPHTRTKFGCPLQGASWRIWTNYGVS